MKRDTKDSLSWIRRGGTGWIVIRSAMWAAILVAIWVAAGAGASLQGQQTARGVEPIISMRDVPKLSEAEHKKSYDIRLPGMQWVDTGANVTAGEVIRVTATGTFALGDGRVVGPDGLTRGWKDLLRQFPLNGAPTGALIGRVSDLDASVPFLVGAKGEVRMPTSGRLFLRVNANDDLEGTGRFDVKLKFAPETAQTEALEAKDAAKDAAKNAAENAAQDATKDTAKDAAKDATKPVAVSALLRPEVFADIPRRVTDQAGNAGDMVNFALVGTQAQIEAAFKAAGWVGVDRSVQDAVVHGIMATLGHEAYTAMPMSTLFLFGRAQDLSFARGDPLKVAAERHHLRVWKTTKNVGGAPLWVGSATHDIGFETDQRNGDVTHKIDPKIDDERGFLIKSFDASGVFSSAAYVTPAEPLRTAHTATGGGFYSDGRVAVMMLK